MRIGYLFLKQRHLYLKIKRSYEDIRLVVLGKERELNYKLKGKLNNICLSIHFPYYTKLS